MEERRVIGIDFGSSQSTISILPIGSDGKPELLEAGGGRERKTIPTVLALDANDDSLIAFGNDVLDVMRHYHEQQAGRVKFVSNFKRYLGCENKSSLEDSERNANKYCQIFLTALANKVKGRFELSTLSEDLFTTCIAHPATWNAEQVRLLKKYTEEAGFPDVRTIVEPIAAMHALKVQEDLGFKFVNKQRAKYMVFDFGGGTLDVCVVETDILGKSPVVKSISGDAKLGGVDFDRIIKNTFFKRTAELSEKDLSDREKAELDNKFREVKEDFAEQFLLGDFATKTNINFGRDKYSLTMSKQELDSLCEAQDILKKIVDCMRDAIVKANIDSAKIVKVILTGGSARWYFLRRLIAKEFALQDKDIVLTNNPFTDVAIGCAISIGRPDAPPDKPGVWVRWQIDEGDWSGPKCLLEPGRSGGSVSEMTHLMNIGRTKYFKPHCIRLSWWTGFSEEKLEPVKKDDAGAKGGEEKMGEIWFYARSNLPCFERIRRIGAAISGAAMSELVDEYKVYLKYEENAVGTVSYKFRVVDAAAAKAESMKANGKDIGRMSHGKAFEGEIQPGKKSYVSLFGFSSRKEKVIQDQCQGTSRSRKILQSGWNAVSQRLLRKK